MRELDEMFRKIGVDCITVWTDKPYIDDIVTFFKMREARVH